MLDSQILKLSAIQKWAYEQGAEPSICTTDQDALEYLATKYDALDSKPDFDKYRAAALSELRRQALVDADAPTEFTVEFSGYGDSGSMERCQPENALAQAVFNGAERHFVDFDWYNNDGGQGDMTWDINTDVITINGSYNVMERVDEMNEETF